LRGSVTAKNAQKQIGPNLIIGWPQNCFRNKNNLAEFVRNVEDRIAAFCISLWRLKAEKGATTKFKRGQKWEEERNGFHSLIPTLFLYSLIAAIAILAE
jgi:hypothetical protein